MAETRLVKILARDKPNTKIRFVYPRKMWHVGRFYITGRCLKLTSRRKAEKIKILYYKFFQTRLRQLIMIFFLNETSACILL